MRNDPDRHSHTFLIHVWLEKLGEGKAEWRGQVQTGGGPVRFFRDWDGLIAVIRSQLPHAGEPELPGSREESIASE